jgi:glycosyltransferase involved in cell wall biosynthesis
MAVVGAGGGNDAVLRTMYDYFSRNHNVTVFTNSKPLKDFPFKIQYKLNLRLPAFGIFQQFATIDVKGMDDQDVLIFLTGMPSRYDAKVVYYHQQMSSLLSSTVPVKYTHGYWKYYYKLFLYFAKRHTLYNANRHFCVSKHLQNLLSDVGVFADVVYPCVKDVMYCSIKSDSIVTVCRISPEKRLENNLSVLSGFDYTICGDYTFATKPYYDKILEMCTDTQRIVPYSQAEHYVRKAKIYFSSSDETLGISVIEAIKAGCVPVVINNTGNVETVPFEELRFDTPFMAYQIIRDVFNGKFDGMMQELLQHTRMFDEKNYEMLLHV